MTESDAPADQGHGPRDVFVVFTGDLDWRADIEAVFEDEEAAQAVADQLQDGQVMRLDFWASGVRVPVFTEHSYVLDVNDRSKDYAYSTNYLRPERAPRCLRSTDRSGNLATLSGKASTPEAAKAMAEDALP